LATNPSCPPGAGEPGGRGRIRDLFQQPFRRRAYTASAYVLLGILLFAGAAYVSMKYVRLRNQAGGSTPVPAVASAPPVPAFRQVIGVFEPRQTITDALTEQGLSRELTNQIIVAARPEYNLARVRAGQNYWICFTREGIFRDFRYPVDDERYLTVFHDVGQDRLVPVMKRFPYETRVEPISALIESSLFLTIRDIGEMDQLALDLADIFGSDIDFYTDIQKGDSFKVLIEKKYLDGQFMKYGEILAAAFKNDRKMLTGFRFEDENGKPAFYAPDGSALKRSFLKSPLRFARISSKFSHARLHPITRTVRPHLGVDYAAPMGTPVQAVGAGLVTGAGYSGNNGRMIRIRHSGGFETMYLHLSRIAVRSGARVSQGQVIGYVGSSGLSTGPHLDFRVLRHGKAVNPLKVIFPPGAPVRRSEFESFAALRDKLNNEIRITDYE
jgi:murein DD-endopeptidase MepM/ murein hydrolase activator NlpD